MNELHNANLPQLLPLNQVQIHELNLKIPKCLRMDVERGPEPLFWLRTRSNSGAVVAVAITVDVSVTSGKSTGWGVGPSSFTRAPYLWKTATAVLGLGFVRSGKTEHGKMLYPFTDGIWLPTRSLAGRPMPLPRVWPSPCPGWLLGAIRASWSVCVDQYSSAIHRMPCRCDRLAVKVLPLHTHPHKLSVL